ncbi:hypothetical protein TNCV_1667091 [Trichonephila clavipes]|nr:hypothetical protein TNCV_1667091 [Trichonephila clavipes]
MIELRSVHTSRLVQVLRLRVSKKKKKFGQSNAIMRGKKSRFYLYPLQRMPDRRSVSRRRSVIFRSLSATYALLCLFTMSVLIENPAACEIRGVIRFLNAKKVKPV